MASDRLRPCVCLEPFLRVRMAAEAWRMLHQYEEINLAARYAADIDAERRSKGNSLRLDSSDGSRWIHPSSTRRPVHGECVGRRREGFSSPTLAMTTSDDFAVTQGFRLLFPLWSICANQSRCRCCDRRECGSVWCASSTSRQWQMVTARRDGLSCAAFGIMDRHAMMIVCCNGELGVDDVIMPKASGSLDPCFHG